MGPALYINTIIFHPSVFPVFNSLYRYIFRSVKIAYISLPIQNADFKKELNEMLSWNYDIPYSKVKFSRSILPTLFNQLEF